jgi:homoserine kinase
MIDEAATEFFTRSRSEVFAFSCSIAGDVPRSRGLGSSVTVRLGVLHGLNALAGTPLNAARLFDACVTLEGHPDNAAPAAFGGFNVVRGANRQTFRISPKLQFVVLIPAFEIETSAARRILPSHVNRLDAVESCGNAAMIAAAFASRAYDKLKGAFPDHLHQPFRTKLIPILPDVIAAAERAGALGGWLSGSGSSIAAATLDNGERIAAAMFDAANTEAGVVITTADNAGVRIVRSRRRAQTRRYAPVA